MRLGGLRGRLAVRAALLAALALAVVLLIAEYAWLRPMLSERDPELRTRLSALAYGLEQAGPGRADRAWAAAGGGESRAWCVVRTASGPVRSFGAPVPPGGHEFEGEAPRTLDTVSGRHRVAARSLDDGTTVILGLPVDEIVVRVRERRLALGTGSVAAVLLAALAAWFGAGLVLRPIGRMTAAARAMQGTPGDTRLPTGRHGDELDDLAVLLNTLVDHEEAALAEERRFAGEAAHELRGPLSVLRLRAEEALASGDAAAMRAALESSLDDCDRVSRLVQSLLELSRAGDRTSSVPVPVADVTAALRTLEPDWAALAAARGGDLAADIPDGLGGAVAPVEVLDTCVSVLLDNALRYGGGGTVRLEARRRDGVVEVDVVDAGPGVGADEAERIFDRLHRGRAAKGLTGGFGIGLPLARRLARSGEGEVMLVNPGEPGARFRLCLPG